MIQPWKKLSEELVYDGYRKVIRRKFKLPDETESDYDIHFEGKTAGALVVTLEGKFVFAKQYRPGPEKIIMDVPGGLIDEGEDPKEAMVRELREETGYIGDVKLVATNLNDAYSTRLRYNFLVTNAKKITDQVGEDKNRIDVVELSFEELRAHLATGELSDVATVYYGLDHLRLL